MAVKLTDTFEWQLNSLITLIPCDYPARFNITQEQRNTFYVEYAF